MGFPVKNPSLTGKGIAGRSRNGPPQAAAPVDESSAWLDLRIAACGLPKAFRAQGEFHSLGVRIHVKTG